MAKTFEVKLDEPIKLESGAEINQLTIRRPKVGDLRKSSGMADEDRGYYIAARMTGLSEPEFDELDIGDLEKIMEIVNDFLPAAEGGEPSAQT